jgi:hypothetical protein
MVETVRMGLGHHLHQMLAATDQQIPLKPEVLAARCKVVNLHHLGVLIQFAFCVTVY